MKNEFIKQAEAMEKKKSRRQLWKKAVGILGCLVVFCTTYALILPAITQENEPVCGLEEHVHSDECYREWTETSCICSPESLGIHKHSADCYDADGNLICGYADFVIHEHDENCYDSEGKLICTLPEIRPHRHTEACYRTEKKLICPLEETPAHTHSSECYERVRGDLICPLEEGPEHSHTDECYEWHDELVCGLEEGEGHTHSDACYQEERVLICGKEEIIPHIHDESCYDADGNLICGMPEIRIHQHGPECISTSSGKELICGKEEHVHSEACFSTPEESPVPEAVPMPEESPAPEEAAITEGSPAPIESDAPEKTTVTEESISPEVETVLTQQTITAESGGSLIKVSGMLPEDAAIRAVPVNISMEDAEVLLAFDISIILPDGSPYEPPEGKITVQITSPEISADDCNIYYVPESGIPEALPSRSGEGEISFDTPHFSTYVVAKALPPAENIIEEGTLPENNQVKWQMVETDDGRNILRVYGNGRIPDYPGNDGPPWRKYFGTTDKIEIGAGITRVGNYAFHDSAAKEIQFSDTVESIGVQAFGYMKSIERVQLPSSLKTIEKEAFAYSSSLKYIELNEGLTTVGPNIIVGTKVSIVRFPSTLVNLPEDTSSRALIAAFEVAEGNPKYYAVDGVLYERLADGGVRLANYPPYRTGSYTIPPEVTAIRKRAFWDVQYLNTLRVPATVTTPLEPETFRSSSMQKIYIEDGVKARDGSVMFGYSKNLRELRLPDDFLMNGSASAMCTGCISIENFEIIPSAVHTLNMLHDCKSLAVLRYNSNIEGRGSWNPLGPPDTTTTPHGFKLIVGNDVKTLNDKFYYYTDFCGEIAFEGINTIHIEPGAFTNAAEPFTNLEGDIYVDASGLIYKYNKTEKTAELFYCPPGPTDIIIPREISPEPGLVCRVNSVGSKAVSYNGHLRSIEIETPSAGEPGAVLDIELRDYAFANCPTLVSINGRTTIQEAEALFAPDKLGYKALYNTGLTGAGGSGTGGLSQDGDRDISAQAEGADEMNINVGSISQTMEWVESKENPGQGRYELKTGDTLQITVSVSNTNADENLYRVYLRKTEPDCSLSVQPGNDYTFNDQPVRCLSTVEPDVICIEFIPGIGRTVSIPVSAVYPSPQSSGGGLSIWGTILKPEEVQGEEARNVIESEQKINADWVTKPDPFELTKTGSGETVGIISYRENDEIAIRPEKELIWKIEFNRALNEADSYGKDYATQADFTDTITLPSQLMWDEELVQGAKENSLVYRANTIYCGSKAVLTVSAPNILGMRIQWDGDTESPVIYWKTVNRSKLAELNSLSSSVSLYPAAIKVRPGVQITDKDSVSVKNTVNTTVHYCYSEDKHLSAEAVNSLSGGRGELAIEKSNTSAAYFGESIEYDIRVYNKGALPWLGNEENSYSVKDELSDELYIRPENIQRMLDEAEANDTPLTVNIDGAFTAPWEQTLGAYGEPAFRHSGNSDMGSKCGTISISGSAGLYRAEQNGTAAEADSVAAALQQLGYAVTRTAKYTCVWNLSAGGNPEFATGEERNFRIYANAKDSFALVSKDWPNQYPNTETVNFSNSAAFSELSPEGQEKLTRSNRTVNKVKREAVINKYLYNNDVLLTEAHAADGDILDYVLKFDHYGSGSYESLPMVDEIRGSQYLLAPVSGNEALASLQLETCEDKGVGYYKLREGEYTNVKLGVDENGRELNAAQISVLRLPENGGLSTTVKWYFENLPGTAYRKTVSYKVLYDTGLTGSSVWSIGNKVWMNDKPDARIYDSLWGDGTILDFDKKIVASRGSTPSGDNVIEEDYSIISEGEKVTYRLELKNTNNYPYVLKGVEIADSLPRNYECFEWQRDVNISDFTVVNEAGANIKDIDKWYVGPSYGDFVTEQGRQYILWPETTEIRFETRGSVYIYFTLSYPENSAASADWSRYAAAAGGSTVDNTFYVYGFPSRVSHNLREKGEAVLQKGVLSLSVTDNLSYPASYSIPADSSRIYYNNRDSMFRVASYYVLLQNTGNNRLYINDIYDELPRGFEFCKLTGILNSPGHGWTSSYTYSASASMGLADLPMGTVFKGARVESVRTAADSSGKERLSFHITGNGSTDSIKYDDKQEQYYLDHNEALVFAYSCSIGPAADTDDFALNTAGMHYTDVLDAGVSTPPEGSYIASAKNPDKHCIDSNDGSCSIISGTQAASQYGFPAGEGEWLVSGVTLQRGKIVPGVTKYTDSYNVEGVKDSIPYKNSVPQNAQVNWHAEFKNTGTLTVTDYYLADILPVPYELCDKVSLSLMDSEDRCLRELDVLEVLEMGRNDSNEEFCRVKILWPGSSQQNSINELPLDGSELEIWNTVKTYKIAGISLNRDTAGNMYIKIHITDPALSVTELGGHVDMYVSAKNNSVNFRNAVYTNKAYFAPSLQKFTEVNAGSGVKGDSGELEYVVNSSPVTVAFGYATSSRKELYELDNPDNFAVSTNPAGNSILLPGNNSLIRYSLYVGNDTDKAMTKLVLIDNLPEPGDTSPFDKEALRDSAFSVELAAEPQFELKIIKDGNAELIDPSAYSIEYSSAVDFGGPQSPDWNGEKTGKWSSSPAGARAFRMIINDPSAKLIPAESEIVLSFTAAAAADAKPGGIAWNSFGYHYGLEDIQVELEAMPLKVGVQLPAVPELVKELRDADGKPVKAKAELTFRFRISDGSLQKDVELTVPEGKSRGELILDEKVMGSGWKWDSAKEYTIEEIGIDDISGWGFGKWDGAGTNVRKLSFGYAPDKKLVLVCSNIEQSWELTVNKVDRGDRSKKLNGAVFGIYSPNINDAAGDDIYRSFPEKPDREIIFEDRTWYLMDVKTADNGQLIWQELKEDSYCIRELRAPDGYNIKAEPIRVSRSGQSLIIDVENTKGFVLPKTGGAGTPLYTAGGLVLMTTALMLMLYKKYRRKRRADD